MSTSNTARSLAMLEAAGYTVARGGGRFDLVAVGPTDIVLVSVRADRWPDRVETTQLALVSAPSNARKLVHRWRRGRSVPDVREVR